jgi:hypothetical protein
MAEHQHGSMNTDAQEKTFDGFMKWTIRVVIGVFVVLLFLAVFGS